MKLTISTSKQKQIINITNKVQEEIDKKGLRNGLVNVYILHTTACITTADLDPGTDLDFLDFLKALTPDLDYRHPHNPAHAPDHIWSSIIGPSVTIPLENGKLVMGTWQEIVLVELDTPKETPHLNRCLKEQICRWR